MEIEYKWLCGGIGPGSYEYDKLINTYVNQENKEKLLAEKTYWKNILDIIIKYLEKQQYNIL